MTENEPEKQNSNPFHNVINSSNSDSNHENKDLDTVKMIVKDNQDNEINNTEMNKISSEEENPNNDLVYTERNIKRRMTAILASKEVTGEAEQTTWVFFNGCANILLMMFFFGSKYSFILPFVYTIKYILMVARRGYNYYQRGWHWFLFDYCYYVNTSLILYLWIFNDNKYFFAVIHTLCSSMLTAVVLFKNAMIFHSIDSTTSLLIHITPNICVFVIKWLNEPDKKVWQTPGWTVCENDDSECNNVFYLLVVPLLCIVAFQIQYQILFRCVFAKCVANDERSLNTYKYLTRKKEKFMFWKQISICGETGRPIMFGIGFSLMQMAYCLPAYFYYQFEGLHLIVILLTCMCSLFYGSKKYATVLTKSQLIDLQTYTDASPDFSKPIREKRIQNI